MSESDDVSDFVLPGLDDTMFQVWTTVSTFSEIDIKPGTIIFCDIDDTLIHHPFLNGEWTMMLSIFFNMKHFAQTGQYNYEESSKASEAYLDTVLEERPIQHTDRAGFFSMAQLASRVVFITARLPSTIEFTYQNLKSVDVDPENYEVRFSGTENKGAYIMCEFGNVLNSYEHVVFIDDQPMNLENVYASVEHSGLKIYRFQRVLDDPYTYYPLPPDFNPYLRFNGSMVEDTRTVVTESPDEDVGLDIEAGKETPR